MQKFISRSLTQAEAKKPVTKSQKTINDNYQA
jgi:hypothetical protein